MSKIHCSQCGQVGHNRLNRMCPVNVQQRTTQQVSTPIAYPSSMTTTEIQCDQIQIDTSSITEITTENTHTYLFVPFEQNDYVKKKGCKWDSNKKKWFVLNNNKYKEELISEFPLKKINSITEGKLQRRRNEYEDARAPKCIRCYDYIAKGYNYCSDCYKYSTFWYD